MAKNSFFQFKQFRIEQSASPMKVGTDGVLLGAWCTVADAEQILDVGTGTGLIALMLAQRSNAKIDAVELNLEAANEAANNFGNSPWSNRLKLIQTDFNYFANNSEKQYNLIVSNPPFFSNSLKNSNLGATMARHTDALTFEQIISNSRQLLKPYGSLAVIIPSASFDHFRECARLNQFYLQKVLKILPKPNVLPKRHLLYFSLIPCYTQTSELVVHQQPNQYSEEFIELTKDFYLNF